MHKGRLDVDRWACTPSTCCIWRKGDRIEALGYPDPKILPVAVTTSTSYTKWTNVKMTVQVQVVGITSTATATSTERENSKEAPKP